MPCLRHVRDVRGAHRDPGTGGTGQYLMDCQPESRARCGPGQDTAVKDWVAWHAAYEDPSSPLSARLRCVRSHLSEAIDRAPAGRVRVVSLCAGQGHDVVGVLPHHPRRDDVCAVLLESDARNVGRARRAAAAQGLSSVEVRHADASLVASFADALPADVLLLCGIFGNVSDRDIKRTIPPRRWHGRGRRGAWPRRVRRPEDQGPGGPGPAGQSRPARSWPAGR
jgi:hypothetical protein